MGKDILRRVRFSPYRKGQGPTFQLTTWDTHRTDEYGKSILGYRLTMNTGRAHMELFKGEDHHCAPSDPIDSDRAVESIMSFLTLRPGDTDADYFEGYTDDQIAFCSSHAETLSLEVMNRYCDENGNPR